MNKIFLCARPGRLANKVSRSKATQVLGTGFSLGREAWWDHHIIKYVWIFLGTDWIVSGTKLWDDMTHRQQECQCRASWRVVRTARALLVSISGPSGGMRLDWNCGWWMVNMWLVSWCSSPRLCFSSNFLNSNLRFSVLYSPVFLYLAVCMHPQWSHDLDFFLRPGLQSFAVVYCSLYAVYDMYLSTVHCPVGGCDRHRLDCNRSGVVRLAFFVQAFQWEKHVRLRIMPLTWLG